MKTSIHVRYLYYSLYHACTNIYVYGLNTHTCMLSFFTIPPLYLLVQVLHEGERDEDLTYRSKVWCREMMLGGTWHDIIERSEV